MRISDWSSDVCSSDLPALEAHLRAEPLQRRLRPDDANMAALVRGAIADGMLRLGRTEEAIARLQAILSDPLLDAAHVGESTVAGHRKIGRASCRERVCQYV